MSGSPSSGGVPPHPTASRPPSPPGGEGTGGGWPFGELVAGRYRAILADPPWTTVLRSNTGYRKAPEAHYRTMTAPELAALPVADLAAPRCALFLWTTWPHLPVALRLMDAWGFSYRTGGPWVKRARNGNAAFGTGFLFRSASEAFLIGTRGGFFAGSRSERNLVETIDDELHELDGFEIDALRREHSRKPDEMRALVDRIVAGGPACELFAREPWPGRDVWGNETAKFGDAA